MSVVLSMEDSGPCRKKLTIEVPAPAVQAELDRVAQEFRRKARLPGFRKGKVPLSVVHQRFGEDIRQEVLDRLLPRYWRQAQAETRLEPLIAPKVDEVELEPGQVLRFEATVEVRPELELGDLEGFELPPREVSISPEEVDEALEDFRRQVAPWVEVERPAARGDLVEGELEQLPDGAAQPVAFEVGDPNVWEELSLTVTGHAAGHEGEFTRPAEGEEERLAFRIRIVHVKERALPELDDELASKVGDFDSLEALRTDLEKRLLEAKRSQQQRRRETALLDQMRERYPSELPGGVVDEEIQRLLTDYARGLAQQGIDPEKADIDWRSLATQAQPRAQREVHARLLLDAAAGKLGVEISQAELEAALAVLAAAQKKSTAAVRQALDRDGRLVDFRTQLLRRKTLHTLLGEEESDTAPGEDVGDNETVAGGADSPGEE